MSEADTSKRYHLLKVDELDPIPCPCGSSRRAFVDDAAGVGSLHIVDIHADSKVHYHKRQTEIYYVLEGKGQIELDGDQFPLAPGDSILIKPGCRHRAVGKLKIINVSIPAFDPEDEWFD